MRYPVLASLAAAPAHGYEIKRGLEERFGSAVAPLNIGQVYTSLQRLQRDELVVDEEAHEGGRDRRVYRLTDAGRARARGVGGDRRAAPRACATTSS